MARKYNILIEKDKDGYYVSEVISLPHCQARAITIEKLIERTKEAINLYLNVKNEIDYPLKFVRIQEVKILRPKNKKYNVLIEKDEDGYYVSEVIGLAGCHSQARTILQLIRRTKEAIKAYLEIEIERENSIKYSMPIRTYSMEFVRCQEIEV